MEGKKSKARCCQQKAFATALCQLCLHQSPRSDTILTALPPPPRPSGAASRGPADGNRSEPGSPHAPKVITSSETSQRDEPPGTSAREGTKRQRRGWGKSCHARRRNDLPSSRGACNPAPRIPAAGTGGARRARLKGKVRTCSLLAGPLHRKTSSAPPGSLIRAFARGAAHCHGQSPEQHHQQPG